MKEGYVIRDQTLPHFITATVVDWVDVFSRKISRSAKCSYEKLRKCLSASISGDSYPSTEAFMQDASGKNGVFIGVSRVC
jgi:hypothetical protein